MTVYLDVIWFLNFCFDALLLMLTGIVLKRKIIKWRIALAAFIGSLIILFMFTSYAHVFAMPLVKILFSLIMVLIAFRFHRITTYLHNVFMFYFVTFVMGGGMLGVHYLFNVEWMNTQSSFELGDPISWMFVIVGFPIVYYFSKSRISSIEVRKVHFEQLSDVVIQVGDITIKTVGLIDSGNQLHDPITRAPVLIMDISCCKGQLPKAFLTHIENPETIGLENDEANSCTWVDRMKIIPYRAVGSGQQFLIAVKPDKLTIKHDEVNYLVSRGLVAFSTTKLSSDEEYGCIVHPKMIVLGQSTQSA
jgi:stage II sporulation protein GA (sporulation sigma-E factor processing peptidase)